MGDILLQSVASTNEVLRADLAGGKRPDLSLYNASPLILGKNATTGIAESAMKRKMVRIQVMDRFVRLEALDELSKISVNGRLLSTAHIVLRANDLITLHAPTCSYSYRIIMKQPNPSPARPLLTKKRKAGPLSPLDLTDEVSCPICLDVLVEATSLVPCGHTICRNCLDQISTECMTCRTPFHTTVPNLITDNVIAKLVAEDHFAPDEISSYRLRIGE